MDCEYAPTVEAREEELQKVGISQAPIQYLPVNTRVEQIEPTRWTFGKLSSLLVFFDTETSGGSTDKDRVLSIGFYVPQTHSTYYTLIKPPLVS